MKYSYETSGTCSRAIDIEVDADGIVQSVAFHGGCNGNTSGMSSLIRGMKASEAIKRLRGIKCGTKQTSCPDQLALALEQIVESR